MLTIIAIVVSISAIFENYCYLLLVVLLSLLLLGLGVGILHVFEHCPARSGCVYVRMFKVKVSGSGSICSFCTTVALRFWGPQPKALNPILI